MNTELLDYLDHHSWRCGHPDRYPLENGDCVCGLIGAIRRSGRDELADKWTAVYQEAGQKMLAARKLREGMSKGDQ